MAGHRHPCDAAVGTAVTRRHLASRRKDSSASSLSASQNRPSEQDGGAGGQPGIDVVKCFLDPEPTRVKHLSGACIIKLITAVIYSLRNKLE